MWLTLLLFSISGTAIVWILALQKRAEWNAADARLSANTSLVAINAPAKPIGEIPIEVLDAVAHSRRVGDIYKWGDKKPIEWLAENDRAATWIPDWYTIEFGKEDFGVFGLMVGVTVALVILRAWLGWLCR